MNSATESVSLCVQSEGHEDAACDCGGDFGCEHDDDDGGEVGYDEDDGGEEDDVEDHDDGNAWCSTFALTRVSITGSSNKQASDQVCTIWLKGDVAKRGYTCYFENMFFEGGIPFRHGSEHAGLSK